MDLVKGPLLPTTTPPMSSHVLATAKGMEAIRQLHHALMHENKLNKDLVKSPHYSRKIDSSSKKASPLCQVQDSHSQSSPKKTFNLIIETNRRQTMPNPIRVHETLS